MAGIAITGAIKSTPNAAMGALLNLPPLHLALEAKAKICAIRLASLKLWNSWNQNSGHCQIHNFINSKKPLWENNDRIVGIFNLKNPIQSIHISIAVGYADYTKSSLCKNS